MKNRQSNYLAIAVFLCAWSFLVCSCTEGKTPYNPEEYKVKLSFPFNTPKVAPDVSLEYLRKQVKSLINERKKNINEDLSELTYYNLVPQYLSNLGKVDASIKYDGYWLKFENDYTFRYGIYNKTLSKGIYHYSTTTQLLLMLDNDENVEPKMWTFLTNSEFANMLGRPLIVKQEGGSPFILLEKWSADKYLESLGESILEAHNGMQIKMHLLDDLPSPPSQ